MTAPRHQPPSLELLERLETYMQINPVGKSLHIVASDLNLEDDCVQFCIDIAKKDGDDEGLWIATEMMKLSYSQRSKLVNGLYGPPHVRSRLPLKSGGATRHECFLG